ncbi:calcium-binding protein [Dongia deserti]|uniref:calcium-binding protein n=1 Tax=Dongia deserti TaxID=2268030 RepID=UPI000E65962A|nr:calcium-binding protein [Dongia deserti]
MALRDIYSFRLALLNKGHLVFNPAALHWPFYTQIGTDKDDELFGGIGADIIDGKGGDDVIWGDEGNNWIEGGSGNDEVTTLGGSDHVFGEDGNDFANLHGGDDKFYGGDGDDEAAGWSGNDLMYGEAGDDYLESGKGEDTLHGGDGNDIFDEFRNYGGDVFEVSGPDWFYGGNGNDQLFAFDIPDAVQMNLLDGGPGFDRLELQVDGAVIANLDLLAGATTGIEAIGLSHCVGTTLFVEPLDVLNFSDESNALYVTGYFTGGFDTIPSPNTSSVDSASKAWTEVGTVQADGHDFLHYQATVKGQQVDLYVDSSLQQAGITS